MNDMGTYTSGSCPSVVPVKFRGVDVGTVKSIRIDPDNSRLVLVEVRLRKETPVKTDTRASLVMKGITGVVFIELKYLVEHFSVNGPIRGIAPDPLEG